MSVTCCDVSHRYTWDINTTVDTPGAKHRPLSHTANCTDAITSCGRGHPEESVTWDTESDTALWVTLSNQAIIYKISTIVEACY